MRTCVTLLALLYCSLPAAAQSVAGLTGKPDTSYTTYSAYKSTVKTHPGIEIVPELKSESLARKKGLVYCTTGNRKLLLDAFYPKKRSKKARTAIVIIHGGGWRSGNRTQHYPLAQHLAALGYVCFTPEYRLSTEAVYPAAVLDLKAAIRWVRSAAKDYNIDTGKIAVLGFSAGGELAAFIGATNGDPLFESADCAIRYSSAASAVIDLDGTLSFVHPESGEGDDSRSTSAATYWFGHPKKENLPLWQEASPLAHAGAGTPPTLFINSAADRMHAGRDDYRKILAQYGIYTEVQTFAGAPHSFPLFHLWFTPTVQYVDAFLTRVFGKK